MRRRESSLNPYAAAYVPLSQREAGGGSAGRGGGSNSNNYDGSGTVWYAAPQNTRDQQNVDTSARRHSPVKSNPASSFYMSPSQSAAHLAEMQEVDEEIDLEYLRMTFPGIAEQSLRDIYAFSNGDIDTAVDMLHQLEFDDAVEPHVDLPDDDVEPHVNLPDTLDIGDVSDSPPNQQNVAAEASTSSGHLASSKFL